MTRNGAAGRGGVDGTEPALFQQLPHGGGKLYRGKQEKVLERYVSDTLARYTDIVKDEIFITHSGVSDEVAAAVRKLLEERGFRTIYTTTASCTISSHCGPGTLGILFMTETPSA